MFEGYGHQNGCTPSLPVPYTIDIKYKMSLFLFFNGAKKSHHSSFSFFYLFCMEVFDIE
jgi:hypothetical protein